MNEVAVIVVLYNPEDISVWSKLSRLTSFKFIFVDNSEHPRFGSVLADDDSVIYIALNVNLGIATAQNIGISEAQKAGVRKVIFFDQDSMVDESLLHRLVRAHDKLKSLWPNAFVLGPVLEDAHAKGRIQRLFENESREFVESDFIASSGSIVNLADINTVGGMLDRLFIANVDYEWVWRAKSKNRISYQTPKIRMRHSIGERSVYLFGRKLGLSSPVRYYYQMRNWFLLLRKFYVPRGWRMREMRNILFSVFYIAIYGPSRIRTIQYALKGVFDGIRGK